MMALIFEVMGAIDVIIATYYWNADHADINHWLFSWLDPTHTYFNRYQHDIAYTFSYKKI